jgi:hypothetical protein
MKAFLETLFGDPATVAVVVVIVACEILLAANGKTLTAALLIPLSVLAGVAWLVGAENGGPS